MIETSFTKEDEKIEGSLRPQKLKDYIGQTKIKDSVSVSIEAAKQRQEPLDHILFYGPPGLGKLRWPRFLQTRWAYILRLPADLPLRSRERWRPF